MERPWVFCTGFPYNTCAVEEKPALLRGQNETENRVCIIQDVEDKLFWQRWEPMPFVASYAAIGPRRLS